MAGTIEACIRVVEFFSGLGGWHCAFEATGLNIIVLAAVDINTGANEVYRHNFPSTRILQRNICGLTAQELDSFAADLFTLSPPCQPFTRQGKMGDSSDHRTDSFFHMMELLNFMTHLPKYIMIENVKGFELSKTRDHLKACLSKLGYNIQEFLLSPKQFGVPNSRLRYYLLGRLIPFNNDRSTCLKSPYVSIDLLKPYIPSHFKDYIDSNNTKQISSYLVEEQDIDRFLVNDRTLLKYAKCLDIVTPSSLSCCCFTRGYYHYSVGTGSVLQVNEGADLDKAYQLYLTTKEQDEALDANQCIVHLKELKLRYFTPREVANLMCFPSSYSFPDDTGLVQCYRLLGNSVNVLVVSTLLCYLLN